MRRNLIIMRRNCRRKRGNKMMTLINKNENIGKVKEILNDIHGIRTSFGWEIVFGMLLSECETHIEVHEYGHRAYFTQK
jgi:hypothetical protein